MKAVLISIRPNWCKLIWSGMKNVEVRKTRPKLETPFKVYIYCTGSDDWYMKLPKSGMKKMSGKVIGEFTCDSVERLTHIDKPSRLNIVTSDLYYKPADELLQVACLTEAQAEKYLKGGDGYGWHISKLKIWDEPVRLKDFWAIQPCTHRGDCCTCRRWDAKKLICRGEAFGIERPPKSWCYVEVGK